MRRDQLIAPAGGRGVPVAEAAGAVPFGKSRSGRRPRPNGSPCARWLSAICRPVTGRHRRRAVTDRIFIVHVSSGREQPRPSPRPQLDTKLLRRPSSPAASGACNLRGPAPIVGAVPTSGATPRDTAGDTAPRRLSMPQPAAPTGRRSAHDELRHRTQGSASGFARCCGCSRRRTTLAGSRSEHGASGGRADQPPRAPGPARDGRTAAQKPAPEAVRPSSPAGPQLLPAEWCPRPCQPAYGAARTLLPRLPSGQRHLVAGSDHCRAASPPSKRLPGSAVARFWLFCRPGSRSPTGHTSPPCRTTVGRGRPRCHWSGRLPLRPDRGLACRGCAGRRGRRSWAHA